MSIAYDNGNYTNRSLKDHVGMDGLTITGACFMQEKLDSDIFPDGMTGVTFVDCNLCNCIVPEGNTIVRGAHFRFKAMDDGHDWKVDEDDNPIERM